jgi:hypothetical protein
VPESGGDGDHPLRGQAGRRDRGAQGAQFEPRVAAIPHPGHKGNEFDHRPLFVRQPGSEVLIADDRNQRNHVAPSG